MSSTGQLEGIAQIASVADGLPGFAIPDDPILAALVAIFEFSDSALDCDIRLTHVDPSIQRLEIVILVFALTSQHEENDDRASDYGEECKN
jgi:hypothetical protein